jgi:AcrR family transcriptional regulator
VRTAVLRAAFDILQSAGIAGLTIAAVAHASGVHETTIYRRWKTPAALALDATMQFATNAVGAPDTGSLRGDLIALGHNIAGAMASPAGQALLEICRLTDPDVAKARGSFFGQRFAKALEIFERAALRGEADLTRDGEVLIELLVAPLYLRALVTNQPLADWPMESIVDRVLAMSQAR